MSHEGVIAPWRHWWSSLAVLVAKCAYHTTSDQHTFAVNRHAVTPPCICFLTTLLLWDLIQLEKQKGVTSQLIGSLVQLVAQTLTHRWKAAGRSGKEEWGCHLSAAAWTGTRLKCPGDGNLICSSFLMEDVGNVKMNEGSWAVAEGCRAVDCWFLCLVF